MAIPSVPLLLQNIVTRLLDHGNDIPLGTAGEQFDYEVELSGIF
jgi:hypothetical protein